MLTFTIKHPIKTGLYLVADIDDYSELADMFYEEHDLNKEEWEQRIEITASGPVSEIQYFEMARGTGCSLEQWFEEVESLELQDRAKLYWLLVECGYDFESALSKLDETTVYRNPLINCAQVIFDEHNLYRIPEDLQCYIDYDKFAADLRICGDLREFEFENEAWTAENL